MSHPQASSFVRAAHARARSTLPFDDTRDFDDANRGFIARPVHNTVRADDGRVVWDNDSYGFLEGEAPDTVHPSLWRVSKLNAIDGLFEVVPGIYQVRGFDLSNLSIVEGDTGIVIIDALTTREPAAAALAWYREHRGDRPVTAVVYTHCHVDHFGGVLGVTDQAAVDRGEVRIIAPEGFTEHAVSENVYAGTAMGRRAGYMYGAALERGVDGGVGSGLGQAPSTGTIGLIVPTDFITRTGQTLTVDGVEMEFQLAPGTEAPAEMHIYLPRFRALCMAENATHTLHNLLTLRGALVRDPRGWAGYLTEAIETFAERSDVVFSPHHWPTWGSERILEFLSLQRDLYAYLHDQTLRMINQGYQGAEIAEEMRLPPALENAWHTRGYYGSVSHNVKAVYQRYMGWFDGNPARLWPHPPAEQAARYVEAMGGIDRVVELAQAAYDAGDYRWAVTLLDHVVFTDRDHAAGRALYADSLEQLAFGIENATWRNFFLSGAAELRGGNFGSPTNVDSPELLGRLSPAQIFDSLAIRVNGPEAWDERIVLDIALSDLDETHRLSLRNGVLIHRRRIDRDGPADATIRAVTTLRLLALLAGDDASPGIEIAGDAQVLGRLFAVLDAPDPAFDIVLP
ncbi:alkyl/aryl-sulfatase [Leucobacter soli]|uniref:Linear primary-alkylsulfatase n=1 Tax=Leucobacter soli TaxID=2812850 RepID=A0A916NNG4_9MICO|nr:alkyl sulfatase dimerization domain-containing protein [Leucobacter soli]CAG7612663.1 Putative alkyl/aryl-sulfatase YjcS [Leucobacter soli]